jgi:hypothetical protein
VAEPDSRAASAGEADANPEVALGKALYESMYLPTGSIVSLVYIMKHGSTAEMGYGSGSNYRESEEAWHCPNDLHEINARNTQ